MKNNKPIISIIVPVYQVEDYIENTMRSICKQSFKEFEVILVDDGTKDRSINLAENILLKYKINFKIIKQNNKGVSVARNIGIKNAKGKWIVCVDSDDILNKHFLYYLYHSCVDNNVKIGFSSYASISNYSEIDKLEKKTKEIKDVLMKKEKMIELFLKRKIKLISPGTLINKNFLVEHSLSYDEDVEFSEDVLYLWSLIFTEEKYAYINEKLYYYLRREKSTMTSSSIDKIMTGYYGYLKLTEKLRKSDSRLSDMILSRWVFGVLHATSRYMNYEEYQELSKKIINNKTYEMLNSFPDIRIRILSKTLIRHQKIFYKIMKLL